MSSGNRETLGFCIFDGSDDIVTVYKIRNMYGLSLDEDSPPPFGTPGTGPTRIAEGIYGLVIPNDLDEKNTSITLRASKGLGLGILAPRFVHPLFTRVGGSYTLISLSIFDENIALTDDFINCEITVSSLPLGVGP